MAARIDGAAEVERHRTSAGAGSVVNVGASTLSASHSVGDRLEVAAVLERLDRLVDAVGQRAVLVEDHAEVLGVAPSGAGNWPMTVEPSTWTAVTKNAVGRSTTMPSIWPFERRDRVVVRVVDHRLWSSAG